MVFYLRTRFKQKDKCHADSECTLPKYKATSHRRNQINNFDGELEAGQETEKQLQANLNHIKDNQLLSRNQHRARLDKRITLFNGLKVSLVSLFRIQFRPPIPPYPFRRVD